MDKRKIKQAIKQIDVPKEDVFVAIDQGLARKTLSRRRKIMISTVTAASLFGITLASGFVNPTMNEALASAPLVGGIYKEFGDSMGYQLAKQDLVTKLNQTQTRQGVTVELTDAYFDGTSVSISGHVSGDINNGGNEQGELSFDKNFEHYKGDEDPWMDGMSHSIKENGNGYDFHWIFSYPYEEIPEKFTLPLTIHSINATKGEWKFDVPITQKKYKTIGIEHLQTYPAEDIRINIKKIITAQASSSLLFETISAHGKDRIDIEKAVDNLGNTLFANNNNLTLQNTRKNKDPHFTFRKMMEKLDHKATSITFYPIVEIFDEPVNKVLEQGSFTLDSRRTDLAIQVNKIELDDRKLLIDYHFRGLPKDFSSHEFNVLTNNLSYGFSLIDKNYLSKIDPDNPFPPENHSVTRNIVTVLDQDNYHFQSVFSLDGTDTPADFLEERIEHFELSQTALQFNFNSRIQPESLKPFTVELP